MLPTYAINAIHSVFTAAPVAHYALKHEQLYPAKAKLLFHIKEAVVRAIIGFTAGCVWREVYVQKNKLYPTKCGAARRPIGRLYIGEEIKEVK